jgi:hypothetical protein
VVVPSPPRFTKNLWVQASCRGTVLAEVIEYEVVGIQPCSSPVGRERRRLVPIARRSL